MGRRDRTVKRKKTGLLEKIRRWVVRKMIRKNLIREIDIEMWMLRPIVVSNCDSHKKLTNLKVIYSPRNYADPLACSESLALKANIGDEKFFIECLFDEQITVGECVEHINRMISDMEDGKALKYFEIRKRGNM